MHIAVRHNLLAYDPEDGSVRPENALVLPMREAEAVMGETVAALLARVAWRFDLPTVLKVNGAYLGRDEWSGTHLAVNDNVEFLSRPLGNMAGGSGGKSILSVVALVALTAVAPWAGGVIAGATGATGFAFSAISSLASAAIVGAGALAISHFLSPKAGGKTAASDELYAFGLQGNAARPMQPVPVLNGRLRFAPDYGAPTYSEYDGDRMIDYALYALTCGRIRPEQVLIGDTPIWDYQTGYNPAYPGITLQFVEPGQQVTLYPVNVLTADEMNGVELTTAFTPGYIVNAAGTTAQTLLFDFVWPGGIWRQPKDKLLEGATHIVVRGRPVNEAGAPIGDYTTIFNKIYTFAKKSQIRVTERVAVPPGRWEVAACRVNPPLSEAGTGSDDVTWTAVRAHIDGPQAFPRVSMLAVRGEASKQLSGISGGQLRVIGTRILPVWRDGLFVEEPTRSIAWAALDWWRNGDYAAGLSLSDTDFQAFVAYDALWTSLGHTFDHRFTEVQNLDDVLETVLKAGRAFPAPVGDKLTLTRDQPRGLSRMLFTENDILRDSLEIDYALSDEAWADGIVGEYLDETTWRLAEVSSAPDGVTLLKPARVQLQGITNRKQATGVVRFMAAESQYRRITVQWTARMEGRLLKRGDLVKITAEEPETWGQSCEIVGVAADGLTLTLDPAPAWEASGNHYVEIRRRDGRPWGPVRVSRGASDAIAMVSSTEAQVTAGQQGMTLAGALARSDTQERPWLAFSPGQPRTFPVLITEGDPDQDGEHIHLTGVLDAPEVYATTENGVPPLIQIPDLFSDAMPVILGLGALITQVQLNLVLSAGWQPARNAASYVADVSYDNGGQWVRAYEGDRTTFEAVVGGSDQMMVRVAGVTPAGVRGAFFVVAVDCPSLVVSNQTVGLIQIDYEDLSANIQAQIDKVDDVAARAEEIRKALSPDPNIRATALDPALTAVRADLDLLSEMAVRNTLALTTLGDQLRAAGLEVLTGEGRARIYAVDRLQKETTTQITNLSVDLNAAVAQ
uniref:host specificity factor TipJ family phage tail protein n=1 Tax=Methylobacterium segetis TaxID=2488750 RepID=UPI001FE1015B